MTEKLSNKKLFKSTPVLPILLQFHRVSIDSEINSFKEYIIDTRHSIQKQQDSFNSMIEEQKKKHPNNIEDLIEAYEGQYYQYNEFYPATFNNSTLLSLYSLFEFNLKNLCLTLQNYAQYTKKLDKQSGDNYIQKSKNYLTLVVGLDLTGLDSIWKELDDFRLLRNCIVHNNSNIIKQKKKPITEQNPLYQIIKNNLYIKLNETRGTFIISNDKYLLDISERIEKYLITVIKKLEAIK